MGFGLPSWRLFKLLLDLHNQLLDCLALDVRNDVCFCKVLGVLLVEQDLHVAYWSRTVFDELGAWSNGQVKLFLETHHTLFMFFLLFLCWCTKDTDSSVELILSCNTFDANVYASPKLRTC